MAIKILKIDVEDNKQENKAKYVYHNKKKQ